MSLLEAAILGLIQAFTEFLPISSTAHMELFSRWLGIKAPGAFFASVVQIGTELALLIYLWPDVKRIVSRWFLSLYRPEYRRDLSAVMGWLIILATIPAGVAGLLLKKTQPLWITAAALIVFGILLGLADRFSARRRTLKELRPADAVIIGLTQVLAIIPGVSRSGSTITAGLFLGFERASAVKFSFLLALPITFASAFYDLIKGPSGSYGWPEAAVGILVAFVVGSLVVRVFMRFISRSSFMPFVYYRILLGSLLLVLVAFS